VTFQRAAAPTLHNRILGELQNNIVSGAWPPGHQLPFEVDIATSYNVSRMTVNKVLTHMARAGLIERRRKRGSFVAQPQSHSAILEIHDIEQEVRGLNLAYEFKLLDRAVRKASVSDLAAFDIKRKIDVLAVRSLHMAGGAPFCFEDRVINLGAVPTAEDVDFKQTPPGKWLRMQVPWTAAEHRIHAIAADAQMSRRLDLAKGAPCLVVQRRTWSGDGPVTAVRFVYPASKHAVVARFTPAAVHS
jgi:GntR family transcriptional regulator, histidine utilization repressor